MSATPFVLDNSVLCGWFLANQTSPYCDAVVDQVALLPIRIDAAPPQPASLLSLALRFQLTSYDAAYRKPPGRLAGGVLTA